MPAVKDEVMPVIEDNIMYWTREKQRQSILLGSKASGALPSMALRASINKQRNEFRRLSIQEEELTDEENGDHPESVDSGKGESPQQDSS